MKIFFSSGDITKKNGFGSGSGFSFGFFFFFGMGWEARRCGKLKTRKESKTV